MRISEHLELEQSLRDTFASLAAALDAKDAYTGQHVRRVARFADAIARELGLPERERRDVRQAALLHDVGKIWVDEKDGLLVK